MWFEDHLKRSMDRLTPDVWEKLLTADPYARPVPGATVATCPCCRTPVAIEVTATLLPGQSTGADTQLKLAAVARTDLVPA